MVFSLFVHSVVPLACRTEGLPLGEGRIATPSRLRSASSGGVPTGSRPAASEKAVGRKRLLVIAAAAVVEIRGKVD